jgi:hypothetical protein
MKHLFIITIKPLLRGTKQLLQTGSGLLFYAGTALYLTITLFYITSPQYA